MGVTTHLLTGMILQVVDDSSGQKSKLWKKGIPLNRNSLEGKISSTSRHFIESVSKTTILQLEDDIFS